MITQRKAQFLLCKDSADLKEWGQWLGTTAGNYVIDLKSVHEYAQAVTYADPAKQLGLTPKQLADMTVEAVAILKEMEMLATKLTKLTAPVAKRLNPVEKKETA